MKRGVIIYASALAVIVIAVSAAINPVPRLIWNASASVPIGYYSVQDVHQLEPSDLLVVQPPTSISDYMERRASVPKGVPLIKHVAALPGQTVCRHGFELSVDGMVIGRARFRDSHGRILPIWHGCQKLAENQIFFMNTAVPDSLDGRYFGTFDRKTIVGRAVPLWTDDDGDGRFIWHGFNVSIPTYQPKKGE